MKDRPEPEEDPWAPPKPHHREYPGPDEVVQNLKYLQRRA